MLLVADQDRFNSVNQVNQFMTYSETATDYAKAIWNSLLCPHNERNAYAAKASQIGASIEKKDKEYIQKSVKQQIQLYQVFGSGTPSMRS